MFFCVSIISWRKRNISTVVALILFGVLFGVFRGDSYLRQLEPYRELTGKKVQLVAKVQSDSVYDEKGQLGFDVDNVQILYPENISVPGRVSVKGFGVPVVYRGNTVVVSGQLQKTRGSRQARISFAAIEVTNRNLSSFEKARLQFVAGVGNALPEPSASFGMGLLMGYRTSLPEITQEQLKITGLTHIIAVSGYNLTIIVRMIRRSLGSRSKFQQLAVCMSLILLFILLTDFSASIIRASIVSVLSLLAWYYGRQFKPIMLLLFTAAITAGWNPTYLWSDIGWYLSFLAFFGIMIVAPLLLSFIRMKLGKDSQILRLIIETSSAQLMTAPLIMMIFSRISIISLVSNLIIAPLVPLAMIGTLIAGLIGMASPVMAGFVAWPARMLLRYMLDMVQVLSSVPYAMIEHSISVLTLAISYAGIVVGIVLLRLKLKPKYDTITDKNMII